MRKQIIIFLFLLAISGSLNAQSIFQNGRIIVSKNGHYLQFENGKPFFWLGDTAWELFHRLKLEEIIQYLDNRQKKGMNVIQAVALAEFNGLRQPNQYGEVPLIDLNPETPNDNYFKLIDTVVKLAAKRNMFIGLLPTWGDKVTAKWGEGPAVFNPQNAYKYGLWIGKRYKNSKNLLWILGGDRPARRDTSDWTTIWREMAKGISEGTGNKAFITYHPQGGDPSTSQLIHNEGWLDMNMMQSGHGGGHDVPVWNTILRDYNIKPAKPTLDAEPNYEDHPVNPWPKWDPANGYYRDYDVRKQIYRSVFSGAAGVTYGHHSVWQFYNPREEKINFADRHWTEAIDRPGAFQSGYLKKLIESRPQLNRIPDQSIIVKGQGEKGEHICATRDEAGTYAMIYIPVGKMITLNLSSFKTNKIKAYWFNPRTGMALPKGLVEIADKTEVSFTSPEQGVEKDWVLILDDARKGYKVPEM